jgi:hypothetical protein
MDDIKFMQTCQLCSSSYQMGPHRYDGKHIARYKLDVCGSCYSANWDGWGPNQERIILAHLEQKGIEVPNRNEKGWLPRN